MEVKIDVLIADNGCFNWHVELIIRCALIGEEAWVC